MDRIPVELLWTDGASTIGRYTRVPNAGETAGAGARIVRVLQVQHCETGPLAARVFVEQIDPPLTPS